MVLTSLGQSSLPLPQIESIPVVSSPKTGKPYAGTPVSNTPKSRSGHAPAKADVSQSTANPASAEIKDSQTPDTGAGVNFASVLHQALSPVAGNPPKQSLENNDAAQQGKLVSDKKGKNDKIARLSDEGTPEDSENTASDQALAESIGDFAKTGPLKSFQDLLPALSADETPKNPSFALSQFSDPPPAGNSGASLLPGSALVSAASILFHQHAPVTLAAPLDAVTPPAESTPNTLGTPVGKTTPDALPMEKAKAPELALSAFPPVDFTPAFSDPTVMGQISQKGKALAVAQPAVAQPGIPDPAATPLNVNRIAAPVNAAAQASNLRDLLGKMDAQGPVKITVETAPSQISVTNLLNLNPLPKTPSPDVLSAGIDKPGVPDPTIVGATKTQVSDKANSPVLAFPVLPSFSLGETLQESLPKGKQPIEAVGTKTGLSALKSPAASTMPTLSNPIKPNAVTELSLRSNEASLKETHDISDTSTGGGATPAVLPQQTNSPELAATISTTSGVQALQSAHASGAGQTGLEVVGGPTVTQQVSEQITPLLQQELRGDLHAASRSDAPTELTGVMGQWQNQLSQKTQSVTVQLNPYNLGPVDVRLTRAVTNNPAEAGSLKIQLSVTTPEAANQLQKDLGQLQQQLQGVLDQGNATQSKAAGGPLQLDAIQITLVSGTEKLADSGFGSLLNQHNPSQDRSPESQHAGNNPQNNPFAPGQNPHSGFGGNSQETPNRWFNAQMGQDSQSSGGSRQGGYSSNSNNGVWAGQESTVARSANGETDSTAQNAPVKNSQGRVSLLA